MKSIHLLALAIALGIVPAWAATKPGEPVAAESAQAHKAQGTVQKVDPNAGIVNLSHGPIPSLNWPAMTMDFRVKDKALLKDVKPGQKVEFEVAQEGQSTFVIRRIVPVSSPQPR